MATAIARKFLEDSISVQSAGVETVGGMVASQEAVKVMLEMGYDVSDHRSQSLKSLNLNNFDIIIAMSPSIADELRKVCSIDAYKLKVWNVPDPYGKGIEDYRLCAKSLEELLSDLSKDFPQHKQAN